MPRIGSIPLGANCTPRAAAAAFLLSSPANSSVVLPFDVAEIEVHAREPYAVVRFSGPEDATPAFTEGHRLVQRGLDLLSILGTQDLVIRDAEDEHILWWSEPMGMVLRLVSTAVLNFRVGPVTLAVRDKDGNVIPPLPSSPRHHIAFRYYRLAQTTDDLFDSCRNMYLAFEVLLSSKYPKASAREREIVWLRRALSAASGEVSLADLGTRVGSDTVDSVLDKIYYDARLPLFHAKEGRVYYAPQDSPASRAAVSDALGVLTQLVLRMAEKWCDARRMGGGVFFGWVYDTLKSFLDSCTAYATNYDGPLDHTERDLSHPRFRTAVRLPCRIAPELQRGKEPALIADATGTDLSSVNSIRCIDIATTEYPCISHQLEAALELDNVARFEVFMHIKATNANQPKSLFRK